MPTEKIRNNYPEIAPPSGKYTRGIRAGNMLFISGCTAIGTDADGKPMIDQMRATLEKLRRIVEAEGGLNCRPAVPSHCDAVIVGEITLLPQALNSVDDLAGEPFLRENWRRAIGRPGSSCCFALSETMVTSG